MKKLVSVLLALLLVGSFAFADVNVGAWGRFLFSPLAAASGDFETADNVAFIGPDWGGRGRVGFNVSASSDNSGFAINVDTNGGDIGIGDQAKSWIKFNDMLTLQFGKIQGDVLRGKIDDSGFIGAIAGVDGLGWTQGTSGKDDIFKRFYPTSGILLDVTPAEGVYLGLALDTDKADAVVAEDMFKKVQLGAGLRDPRTRSPPRSVHRQRR
jgi:hypothetical protein